MTARAIFWTLVLFNLCLSNSPTAADANKYKQLNGSSDDDGDDGETSVEDNVHETDGREVCEVWATIPVVWLSQLTIEVFELRGGLNDKSKAVDFRLVSENKALLIVWLRICSSSWFFLHLLVNLSGESVKNRLS